jgi:hypothetical protein
MNRKREDQRPQPRQNSRSAQGAAGEPRASEAASANRNGTMDDRFVARHYEVLSLKCKYCIGVATRTLIKMTP